MSTLPVPDTLFIDPGLRRLLDLERERINHQWQQLIERFAARLEREWERFSENFDIASAEVLEAEELAPIFTMFARLRRLGVRFDPTFIERLEELRQEAVTADVDGDTDAEMERCHDDGFGTNVPAMDLKSAYYACIGLGDE